MKQENDWKVTYVQFVNNVKKQRIILYNVNMNNHKLNIQNLCRSAFSVYKSEYGSYHH